MAQHRVVLDQVGTTGRSRLSCTTCRKVIARRPYVRRAAFAKRTVEFMAAHPATEILDLRMRCEVI